MRIVVTGGAGFIGSNVCDALLARGDSVFCIDNLNDYYFVARERDPRFLDRKARNLYNAFKKGCVLLPEDLCDNDRLNRHFPKNIDVVVHLAAQAGVRAPISENAYYTTNVEGTRNIINVAYEAGVRRFVIASSSSVYGTNDKIPFSETDLLDPERMISVYARTKFCMEKHCARFQKEHSDALLTLLRFFTVYGPRGRPDMAPYLFTDLIWSGKKVKKFGDGTSKRDYTYIADIVDGIVRAIDRPFPFEIINLGSNCPVTLNRFIKLIETELGREALIEQHPPHPLDVPVTYADVSKAHKLLGWKPTTGIEEGIKHFVRWYKDSPESSRKTTDITL